MSASVQVGVGQQRQEARALDGLGQLPLVAGRRPGDARRDDLAGLVDEVLEDLDVLVVDPLGLLGREAAELAPAEQRPLALVLLVLAELPFAFSFASARRGHLQTPSTNSMLFTCSTSLLERRLLGARKPLNRASTPSFEPAISRACASKAIAGISACTLRFFPASSCSDSCVTLNSTTGMPAGVKGQSPRSGIFPLTSTRLRQPLEAPQAGGSAAVASLPPPPP